jgi:hypothetical protein
LHEGDEGARDNLAQISQLNQHFFELVVPILWRSLDSSIIPLIRLLPSDAVEISGGDGVWEVVCIYKSTKMIVSLLLMSDQKMLQYCSSSEWEMFKHYTVHVHKLSLFSVICRNYSWCLEGISSWQWSPSQKRGLLPNLTHLTMVLHFSEDMQALCHLLCPKITHLHLEWLEQSVTSGKLLDLADSSKNWIALSSHCNFCSSYKTTICYPLQQQLGCSDIIISSKIYTPLGQYFVPQCHSF